MSRHQMTKSQESKFVARKDPKKLARATKVHKQNKKKDQYSKYKEYRFICAEDF